MKTIQALAALFFFCAVGRINAFSEEAVNALASRALNQQPQKTSDGFTLVTPPGQLDGSVMGYRINPNDPWANGKDTVTVVYRVPARAWAAIGFSDNGGQMVGSEAVIALPDSGQVLKYNLNAKSPQGVNPMPEYQQTLIESGISQDATTTTMAFTKIMVEPGEIPILAGQNTFLGAWGSSNTLGIHSNRQPFGLDLTTGLFVDVINGNGGGVPPPAQQEPPAQVDNNLAAVNQDGFTAVNLQGQLQGSTLQFRVNLNDANAGGEDTVTVVYTIPQVAWCAIAVSDNGGFMIGSEAIIALPDTGEVLKYNLDAKSVPGVVPMPENQQTLIDASVTQDGVSTTLTFTKLMVEDGEIPISNGANTFLGAWGSANTLGIHAIRDSFEIDLSSGGINSDLQVRKQAFWKAHGLFAGIAWGLLSPLAISASVLRKLFKDGPLWFKIHRGLNMCVVLFTVAAFLLAVIAINLETPEGASPNHFSRESTSKHRLIGLVIFIIAFIQALLGIFRPHVPDAGEKKPLKRYLWELAHKGLGYICLGLAVFQVQSGIQIYQTIFAGSGEFLHIVFWTVFACMAGGVLLGLITIQIRTERGDVMPVPTKAAHFDDEEAS